MRPVTRRSAPMDRRQWLAPLALIAAASCVSPVANDGGDLSSLVATCTIPTDFLADGGPGVDGIPALTNPPLVGPTDATAAYVRPTDRVIGLLVGDEAIAVPVNIGWWHEIVNLDIGGLNLAVSYCPLTGSSLVFERLGSGQAAFGVSGLLFMNNLVMYDRTGSPSLWPQMARGARCGSRAGTQLPLFPAVEMTWASWLALHPETRVVSSSTGHSRDYRQYPYGDYEREDNAFLLAPVPRIDGRRPPKERVLGIVLESGDGLAIPFGMLRANAGRRVVTATVGTEAAVVFWDPAAEAAAAFQPSVEGQSLTFRALADGYQDDQTASRWTLDGRALSGPLAGSVLRPIGDVFVAFWFAWALFYPDAALWTGA